MVSRSLQKDKDYWLLMDERSNRDPTRIDKLYEVINNTCYGKYGVYPLRSAQSLDSHHNDLLQVADILIGTVRACFDQRTESLVKSSFCAYLASQLNVSNITALANRWYKPFDVWLWRSRK